MADDLPFGAAGSFIGTGGMFLRGHLYAPAQAGQLGYQWGAAFDYGYYGEPGSAAPVAQAASAATGVNPTETSYSLYGHSVPLSVLGLARIGGEIIAGPWVNKDAGTASFCISFGVPADPAGSRTLREIAFDSEVMWTSTDGYSNENHFTYRWYQGTLTQGADPLEISHFGADAVAYRPQMLLWFEDLPLGKTKFNKIPYVAALIADASGADVNLGEAFERLAYSPYVGFDSTQFVTEGITDSLVDGGMIITEQADFLSTIQQFGRFYKNWDILQTDKLKIVDHGSKVTADLAIDKTHLIGDILYNWAEANSTSRVLELSTIDNGADYTIVPSQAKRPLEPIAVSAAVRTESAYLPVVMDAHTRQALVTYTKYQEEITRKKISGTATIYGLELEPGDMIGLTGLGPDFQNEVFKITETLHGVNYTVQFSAESLFNCNVPFVDPYFAYVVLLMGFEGGGTVAITDESPHLHGVMLLGTGAIPPDDAFVDITQSKFGSASIRPPCLYGGSEDWHLSSANSDQFTVECWAKLDSTLSPGTFQVMLGSSYINIYWQFVVDSGELSFGFRPHGSGSLTSLSSSGASIVGGIWYHFAVDKDSSGKIRLYKNGTMVASATPANSNFENDGSLRQLDVGQIGFTGTNRWRGRLDEIRITKGIARYHSDSGFAVPSSGFPRTGP